MLPVKKHTIKETCPPREIRTMPVLPEVTLFNYQHAAQGKTDNVGDHQQSQQERHTRRCRSIEPLTKREETEKRGN